jgi:hypothetical protein
MGKDDYKLLRPDLDRQFDNGFMEGDDFLAGKKRQFVDDFVDAAIDRLPKPLLPLNGLPTFDPELLDLEQRTKSDAMGMAEFAYATSPERLEDEQRVRDKRTFIQGKLSERIGEDEEEFKLIFMAEAIYNELNNELNNVLNYFGYKNPPELYVLNIGLMKEAEKPKKKLNYLVAYAPKLLYDLTKVAENQGFESAKSYMKWYLGRLNELHKQEIQNNIQYKKLNEKILYDILFSQIK